MRINVIGLGYIGLPTALMLASTGGAQVFGTDYNDEVITKLNSSIMPFEEVGLADLFVKAKKNGIEFTKEYQQAENYIIAVPTPFEPDSKLINPSYLLEAIKSVLDICPDGARIIIESTVAPGTIDQFIRPIVEKKKKSVHLAHAPERILPGQMLYELNNNSRTIGVDDEETGRKVIEIYKSFCRSEIIVTDIKTAEMTKVVENTYRDINIAFANELAGICESDGMDVYEVIRIANKHPRVSILSPGPGVGGHCIAVDPWFLVGRYKDKAKLIRAAREVNEHRPFMVAARIEKLMRENGITDRSKVGLYGLTYKENINDVRESPTLQLLSLYENDRESHFCVYDPYVKTIITTGQFLNMEDFINSCEMIVIMVAHDEIKSNIYRLNDKLVLDTRNIVYNIERLYQV